MVHKKQNEHSIDWGWDGCGKGLGKTRWGKGQVKSTQDHGSLGQWLCYFRTHVYFFLRKFLSFPVSRRSGKEERLCLPLPEHIMVRDHHC